MFVTHRKFISVSVHDTLDQVFKVHDTEFYIVTSDNGVRGERWQGPSQFVVIETLIDSPKFEAGSACTLTSRGS